MEVLNCISNFWKSGHASLTYLCVDTDDNHGDVSAGVYPHPGQWVECVQALHRIQGAPQSSEITVSSGGHLQLPTQESHREQGELIVNIMCVFVSLSATSTLAVSHLPTSAMMNCVSLLSCLVAEMSSFTLLIIAQLPLIKLLFTSVHNFFINPANRHTNNTKQQPKNQLQQSRRRTQHNLLQKHITAESQRNVQQMNRKQKHKPEKLNSKHVCQYESSKFVNWTELKCKHIKISEAWHFSLQNILKPKWRRQ